jgi:hypothetical protein
LKKLVVGFVAVLFALGLLTGMGACSRDHRRKGPEIKTPYAAVLLDNNQLYYGKLVDGGSSFPELTDVYYIVSQVNQETKEVKKVLVRRGNEFHGPDRMFLNEHHIVLIEPVGANSEVAKLIEEDKKKR